jgi:hypothetical protein
MTHGPLTFYTGKESCLAAKQAIPTMFSLQRGWWKKKCIPEGRAKSYGEKMTRELPPGIRDRAQRTFVTPFKG